MCSLLVALFLPPPRSSFLDSRAPDPGNDLLFVSMDTANFTADRDMARRRDRVSGHRPRLTDGDRALALAAR